MIDAPSAQNGLQRVADREAIITTSNDFGGTLIR
jgi:hypothetical protein